MNRAEQEILEREISDSNNVSKLKRAYLDKFFAEKKVQIFDFIQELSLGDSKGLEIAHHQLKSISSLEREIETYIDSGKLARVGLDDYDN